METAITIVSKLQFDAAFDHPFESLKEDMQHQALLL